MSKAEVLARIKQEKVVALLHAGSSASLLDCAQALSTGGLNCLEPTMTTPGDTSMAMRAEGEKMMKGGSARLQR